MGPLSDILNLMQLSGTLYFRKAFTAPSGVAVPEIENVSGSTTCIAAVASRGSTIIRHR